MTPTTPAVTVRYADDFVLGFIGPSKPNKRRSCATHSSWSYPRRKLSNPRHQPGGAVPRLRTVNQQANDQQWSRRVNGQIGLRVPANVIAAKPTCAKANRHTAVTYSTMKISPSWHSTSRSSGASSTTTFWPTTSPISGDCNRSWRCLWHGPLRQSTVHRTEDARQYKSVVETEHGPRSVSRSSSNGTTASHLRGIFRWHPPETATAGVLVDQQTVQERPQRAYQTARSGHMRDVRLNRGCRSPPHPGDLNVKGQREKQVGTTHRKRDPRGLPDVSHEHPPRAHVIRASDSR